MLLFLSSPGAPPFFRFLRESSVLGDLAIVAVKGRLVGDTDVFDAGGGECSKDVSFRRLLFSMGFSMGFSTRFGGGVEREGLGDPARDVGEEHMPHVKRSMLRQLGGGCCDCCPGCDRFARLLSLDAFTTLSVVPRTPTSRMFPQDLQMVSLMAGRRWLKARGSARRERDTRRAHGGWGERT